MKKNHSPGGIRVVLRMLVYVFIFIAVMGARENLSSGNRPVSRTVARAFNQVLMVSSKLGIGFAVMNQSQGDEETLVGKSSRQLFKLSHQGYITASRMNFYASL